MKKGKVFTVQFRRKRQGRTHYKKRLKILLSSKYRFVVRRSLRNFRASVIQYSRKGDKVILTVDYKALDKIGWRGGTGNIPSAYLIGYIAGKKTLEKGIKEAILDIGFNKSTKGSRLYAGLAGAIDSGLKIPHQPEVLPTKERLSGEHIAKYAHLVKKENQIQGKQFSDYSKKNLDPEDIVNHFNEIKRKINA